MYSTFQINSDECLVCNNQIMSKIGELQGVFGAEVDFVNGRISVNHTDEVSREDISKKLEEIGFKNQY